MISVFQGWQQTNKANMVTKVFRRGAYSFQSSISVRKGDSPQPGLTGVKLSLCQTINTVHLAAILETP